MTLERAPARALSQPAPAGLEPSRVALALAVAALLAALPLVAGGYTLYLGTEALIMALAAVSLDLLVGYLGLTSMGHAAFVGLGAYGAGLIAVHAGAPAPVGWLGGVGLGLLFALLTAPLALRSGGIFFLMTTLAFAQMAYALAEKWLAVTGGNDGLKLPATGGLPEWAQYLVALAALALTLAALSRVVRSPFGRALEAVRLNETRARALGFDTHRLKFAGVLLAGGLAGLAGALAAQHRAFVSPHNLHWLESAVLVVMVLLGGKRSLYGPVLGAVTYTFLQSWVSSRTELWALVVGLVLVGLVLSGRDGLWGFVGAWLRRRP